MKDKQLENFLLKGRYNEAKKYVMGMCWEDVESAILTFGYDDNNLSIYSFTKYMFDDTKDKKWRVLLDCIDDGPLCWVEGIHSIHLAHLRELIKNERTLENLELLFYFNVSPDTEWLIDISEKIKISEELLRLEPSHKDARAYLNENSGNCKFELTDDRKSISDLEDLLDKAQYEIIADIIKDMDLLEVRDILVNLSEKVQTVETCGFVHYMIKKTKSEQWFRIQIDILTLGLQAFIDYGVNSIALYYVRELVKISRSSSNLELYLKLYSEPYHIVDRNEAEQLAKEILNLEPENQSAKEVLEKY